MKTLLVLSTFVLSACVTLPSPYAPGAEKVVFTHDAKAVVGCPFCEGCGSGEERLLKAHAAIVELHSTVQRLTRERDAWKSHDPAACALTITNAIKQRAAAEAALSTPPVRISDPAR